MRAVSAPPRPDPGPLKRSGDPLMTQGDAGDPLRELGRRIEGAKRTLDGKSKTGAAGADLRPSGNAFALAWRIGIELVGAVVVASAIGWAIDRWLGTRPWGMIVMFFLGVAAGMLNVWRAVAGMGLAVGTARTARRAAEDRPDDED